MGTYRSSYPMMSDANQSTSVPHFAWFHPGNFSSAHRNGINPFQGSQHNPEGLNAIPIRSIPINETGNTVAAEPELEPKPTKSAKKPKTSRKMSDDGALKEPKPKKSKKSSSKSPKTKDSGTPSAAKRGRRNVNPGGCEPSMDPSGNPSAFCSCTGVPRQCYRWGAGGWQSACCTTNISEYPLPMSTTRPGSRTAGRKMSHGAFDKLLQRLTSDGYDLTCPIDLKDHWARHGTNKFVTIK